MDVEDAIRLLNRFPYKGMAQTLQELLDNQDWAGILDYYYKTIHTEMCLSAKDKNAILAEIMKQSEVKIAKVLQDLNALFVKHKFTAAEKAEALALIKSYIEKMRTRNLSVDKIVSIVGDIIANILSKRPK